MKLLKINENNFYHHLDEIINHLKSNKIIAMQTDTIYGLFIDGLNKEAFTNLIKVKERSENKTFQVVFSDLTSAMDYIEMYQDDFYKNLSLLTTKLTTVVVNKKEDKEVPSHWLNSQNQFGIRIPQIPFIQKIIKTLGHPLIATSLNKSGKTVLKEIGEIKKVFDKEVDLLIQFEDYPLLDKGSTVLTLDNKGYSILREGALTKEDITQLLSINKEYSRIYIGSDHGGLTYKNSIVNHLHKLGFDVEDCGTYSLDSCDYPDYAFQVAKGVSSDPKSLGVVVCTSGEGVSIVANKVDGVRCGLAYNTDVAAKIREHNNCNIVAIGQKYFSLVEILSIINIYITSKFEGGRHQGRVQKIIDLEKK